MEIARLLAEMIFQCYDMNIIILMILSFKEVVKPSFFCRKELCKYEKKYLSRFRRRTLFV